jgi:DNA-binding MarR family transcriptional regulator
MINDLITHGLDPVLERCELTHSGFALLSAVRASDGEETQADIGRRLGLSRATVSESVTELEKLGLLVRHASRTDKRAVILGLTATGQEKINVILTELREFEESILEQFSPLETAQAAKVLHKIVNLIESVVSE